MEEIVRERGIRRVMLYDDLFTLDDDRVTAICRGILERGLSLRWNAKAGQSG